MERGEQLSRVRYNPLSTSIKDCQLYLFSFFYCVRVKRLHTYMVIVGVNNPKDLNHEFRTAVLLNIAIYSSVQ